MFCFLFYVMLIQRVLKNYSGYQNKFFKKCCSTAQNENFIKKKLTTKTQANISNDVKEYLIERNLEHLIYRLPMKLLRKRKYNLLCPIYLIHPDTARTLSSIISEDLLQNTSHVIECNPGLGLLTEELLNIGVPHITLHERFDKFTNKDSPLSQLVSNNKERLNLKKTQFFSIWLLSLHDKYHADRLTDHYLLEIPKKDWKSESCCQIITMCPSKFFVVMMTYNFAYQTRLFSHGRPCFFLVFPFYIWKRLSADHSDPKYLRFYYNYNVMLHLFFDSKYLGELPRKDVVPWFSRSPKSKVDEINEPMVVIKIEPKKNTFDILNKEDLQGFWYFLRHCMRCKKRRVIAELEKLIPGCGPRLIEQDINICTTFKELSPEKLLDIYKKYRLWPEYDENLFLPDTRDSTETKKEDEKSEYDESLSHVQESTSFDVNTEDSGKLYDLK